jgi:hypothetical protein
LDIQKCIKHDLELVYGKKSFFCISMLQLAENCPQCSFHLKKRAQPKIGHPECIKRDLELVYGKVLISAFPCSTC